ncbi:MAG: ABC transporter permease [Betaproteobacteria bacterium]|nr:ABC transporter permease [Betaproteobacteria bacterium]
MKLRSMAFAAGLAAASLGATLGVTSALAQAKEQFFPVLVYRTGAYAPNGVPFANGYVDYLKYVNAKGGINGVKISFEECETGYATDKGVECYERLKGKGATVFQPLSTGITFALTDKVITDKIPLITAGYGRADSADGMAFRWNFPLLGTYWTAADVLIQHLAKKEGAEPDVKDVGANAKGYNALAMQHGAEPNAKVVKDILATLHDKNQGTGPKDEVGQVLYMRGLISAMLGVEGVKAAQERYGKGKVMNTEQVRWGLENLNLDQKKIDALGFSGVMRPVSTSCADHMGASWARLHTWDGAKWSFSSDWYQADDQILKPLIRASADKYMTEKKLQRRTAADCQ